MARRKTNRQVLVKMVRELDDVYVMLLRLMVLEVTDEIIKNQEQYRIDMAKHIISPELYIRAAVEIKRLADFEKETRKS